MTEQTTIAMALAAAQAEMDGAKKNAKNPHLKNKYADLAAVCDAVMPALTKHGIAVVQPLDVSGEQWVVVTRFIHGPTGETLETPMPILLGKKDMQGLGSAITYARRYGLMCLAGIAPEDDDGNEAARNSQAPRPAPRPAPKVSPEDAEILRDLADRAGTNRAAVFAKLGLKGDSWADTPADQFTFFQTNMQGKIDIMALETDGAAQ